MSNQRAHDPGMPRSRMLKNRVFAFAAAIAALTGAGSVAAQDFSLGWNPRSGDVWIDTQLSDVNRYGSRYRQPFVDEMVRYYGAPRDLVSTLLVERNWAPGDVYYACAIAQILGRPCRYVVDVWERDHGQGWGNVAKQLGIKPGSPEFHRLKRGFVPTYDRWARPIRIDEDLYRDYPDRARAIRLRVDAERGHDNSGGKAHGNSEKSGKGNSDNRRKGNSNSKGNNGKGNNGKGNKGGKD
ncbi:hypothetical protein [Lysobacter sp. F6437]|uniref:hypothetical protein n=1 Tax=Lysobacter sp. F6437 TaxID=3459296 RepID=UPI00403E2372